MDYDTCNVMAAWRDGLLSHGEALAYIGKWSDEIISNLMVSEAIRGEDRMSALLGEAK